MNGRALLFKLWLDGRDYTVRPRDLEVQPHRLDGSVRFASREKNIRVVAGIAAQLSAAAAGQFQAVNIIRKTNPPANLSLQHMLVDRQQQ